MGSILSEDFMENGIPAQSFFTFRGCIEFGYGMQKSVRGKFFKYALLNEREMTKLAADAFNPIDACLLTSRETWVGWLKNILILRPGQRVEFIKSRRSVRISAARITARKHTLLPFFTIIVEPRIDDETGDVIIDQLFEANDKGHRRFFYVDIV